MMRSALLLLACGLFLSLAPRASAADTPAPSSGSGTEPVPEPVPKPVPKIVLYTMGQGDVIWEKFGHAAICLEYPPGAGRRSLCYNYGTTDFSAPVSVGWGFLRGEGLFWASRTTPRRMIRRYMGFDRTIWRQVLPLSDEQALAVVAKLEHDSLPENRYYTYHHFHDNCTTRIRDIIDNAAGGALKRDTADKPGPSFRDFSRQGLAEQTGLLLLSDILLGRDADTRPDMWQAMFLPRYLRAQVQERLGAEPELIYERRGRPFIQNGSSGRGWLVLLALVLAVAVAVTRYKGRFERTGLLVAAVPLSLLALILWFLAVVTAVKEFRYNEALLVFWPTDIALPFMSSERRSLYARARIAVLALVTLLLAVGIFTQPLWAAMLVVLLPMLALAVPHLAGSRARRGTSDKTTAKSQAGKRRGALAKARS